MEGRKVIRSYHIPAGPLGHELSPLARLGHGLSTEPIQEFSLSSAWLWKSSSQEVPSPRFTVGFPEEWQELSQHLKSPSHLSIDLWIFRNLAQTEMDALASEMELHKNMRVILAANHLMAWKSVLQSEVFQTWMTMDRAFLSFLPSQQNLDPFLKPQEVLWELQQLDPNTPVFITEFPSERHNFYRTLRSEDHPLLASDRRPFLFRVFKSLEFWGFGHLILALEALLGFLLHGHLQRLGQFFQRFFTPPDFVRKSFHRFYYRGPHRLLVFFQFKTEPALLWIYHRWLRPVWTLLRYQWVEKRVISPIAHFWIGLRHRFLPSFKNWIWYRSLFQIWNLLRHRALPAFLQIAWYRTVLPSMIYLKCRFFPWLWIFLRHRFLPQLLKRIWYQGIFQFWILIRYKSIPALLWLLYPVRKTYWILDHEFEKRLRKRIRD